MFDKRLIELYRGDDWQRELALAIQHEELVRKLTRQDIPQRALLPHPNPMMLQPAVSGFNAVTFKLEVDNNNGNAGNTGITELKFYDAGNNQIATTGGTVFSGGSGSTAVNGEDFKAFDGNTGTGWLRTSATNTWIAYKFATSVSVARIEMVYNPGDATVCPKIARLRYSSDTTDGSDGTWTTAFEIWEPSWANGAIRTKSWPQTLGNGSYKAFRWNVTANNGDTFTLIQEAQIMLTVGGADQCNNGLAFGSHAAVNETPDKAFDNADGNNYDMAGPNTGYLGYYVETAFAPAQYSLRCTSSNTRTPKTWDFQGSNDPTGASWTTLNSQSNQSWSVPETKTYNI